MGMLGKEVVKEDANHVWVKIGAGESWHDLVMWAIDNGWGGIENLALIPGSVGAAPMQNIGAYGVEIKETFDRLEAYRLADGKVEVFDNLACRFGYRESVFKHEVKGQYIITSVTLKLSKNPIFHLEYGAIQDTMVDMGVAEASLRAVAEAVMHIRRSKLPDPAVIGNAGSFFKNPELDHDHFVWIEAAHPYLPHYPAANGLTKIPAAWMIEQSGWKGYREGNFGVHDRQALVLVNHGGAAGADIWNLAMRIQADVEAKFGVKLMPEVNVV
jgi:UDP-N-acetylmuramate dehydrogenase